MDALREHGAEFVPRAPRRPCVILQAPEDVLALLDRARSTFTMPITRVKLAGISPEERALYEGRINAHALACGCKVGSLVAALALMGWVLQLSLRVGEPAMWRASDWLWGAGVCIGLAIVGKLAALMRARYAYISGLEGLIDAMRR